MIFLSLVATMAIVYWLGSASLFHHDSLYIAFVRKLRSLPAVNSVPLLPMALAFLLPLAVLGLIIWAVIVVASQNVLFLIYVPVLLYSLGRGDFLDDVKTYVELATRGDSVAAVEFVEKLGGRAAGPLTGFSNWKTLHTQALRILGYRAFERNFAVLFWFVIAGAMGALLYRLSVIYREQTDDDSSDAYLADKWLWLIEFPAVRLMGLTWAFVGNFESKALTDSLTDTETSSIDVLNRCLRSALSAPTDAPDTPVANSNDTSDQPSSAIAEGVNEVETGAGSDVDDDVQGEKPNELESSEEADELDAQAAQAEEDAQEVLEDLVGINLTPQAEPAYSFALVKSSVPLYSRSLLFWVGAVAFATLFIN